MRAVAPGLAAPACTADPDRWFDRRRRTAALAACLGCPVRPGCAREALRTGAPWGMWAGVWIDGHPEQAVPHLRAIAADWPPRPRSIPRSAAPIAARPVRAPLPHRRPIARASIAALVAARSSGHCEVMTDGCTLGAQRELSRVVGRTVRAATSAAEVYAACGACAQALDSSPAVVHRGGYLLEPGTAAAGAPFHWRGTHWVLLGTAGDLLDAGELASVRSA